MTNSEAAGNIKNIDDMYAAVARGDWDRIGSIFSTDIVVTEAPALPYGGTYEGLDGFRQLMERVSETWTDLSLADLRYYADQDDVVASFTLQVTSTATGRGMSMPVIEKWRFRDGKVVSGQIFYYDTHAVRQILTLD